MKSHAEGIAPVEKSAWPAVEEAIRIEDLNRYIREGRKLQAEALQSWFAALGSFLRNLFAGNPDSAATGEVGNPKPQARAGL